MLIMLLAHARASGDGSYISKYVSQFHCLEGLILTHFRVQYPLLREWADYLVNNTSPIPSDQLVSLQ